MGQHASSLLHPLQLIIEDAIARMPDPPQPQRRAAVRAHQRIASQGHLHPLPIAATARPSQSDENLLHRALHRRHHLLPHLGDERRV